jgi:hypothetical protein
MKTERKVILRRIKKCHRRIKSGYTPVEGQESEQDRLERLTARLKDVEVTEVLTKSAWSEGVNGA